MLYKNVGSSWTLDSDAKYCLITQLARLLSLTGILLGVTWLVWLEVMEGDHQILMNWHAKHSCSSLGSLNSFNYSRSPPKCGHMHAKELQE